MNATLDWFDGYTNEAAIKEHYRELAKQHHPDLGGCCATMQDINAAYEMALKADYRAQGMDEGKAQWRWTMDEEAAAKVAELLKVKAELKIELCGLWLWITGETRAAKDELKALGCRWAPKKGAWYWRREIDGMRKWHKRTLSLAEIRAKYGSDELHAEQQRQAAAVGMMTA